MRAALNLFVLLGVLTLPEPTWGIVLWSDLGATLIHESGMGIDILGGAVKRDDTSSDALYFKFHIDPLSDVSTEEYFAGFQMFEGSTERLGVGNSQKAWAYSAFNTTATGKLNKVFGDVDLRSGRPEPGATPGAFLPYELPRRGIDNTIVFKVQFRPGADDQITVWLNPDLTPGATEQSQTANLVTTFKANASFDEIRLRHGGGGGGWTFSDMAIATAFSDFVSGSLEFDGNANARVGGGSSPLTFRSWQREQGLPQNPVRALARTADGYLWVGGDDGVARFDGVRFLWYGFREGLRGGRVRVLFGDSRGALWIGTAGGGLTRRQDEQFSIFSKKNGLPSDNITALAEDGSGRLWVGTDAGLAIRNLSKNNQSGQNMPNEIQFEGHNISAIFKAPGGVMWVGVTGIGVFQFGSGKFIPLEEASITTLLTDPHALLIDRANRLWLGAGDDFLLCRDGNEWRRYRVPRHLERPYVNALVENVDGTIWAASVSEGLLRFHQGKLAVFNAGSGLSDNFVEALVADPEGNLWVGTGTGLTRIRQSKLSIIGQNERLGYGAVQGMAEIRPGIIWAVKAGDGLFRWDGRSFSRSNDRNTGETPLGITALLAASDETCWAASARGLLHFTSPSTESSKVEEISLGEQSVVALAEGHSGIIWAGTKGGRVWQGKNDSWRQQTNFSATHPISALVESTDTTLWIGTEGEGLHVITQTDSNITNSSRVERRLGQQNELMSDYIRALSLDSSGVMWIGTRGGGLSRWANGKITTFTSREGLPDNTVSQILDDGAGWLWLGTDRGIARVNKDELKKMAEREADALYPQIFNRADGMLSEECTGGFCPAGLRTKTGQLWFSTSRGIVVAEPRLSKDKPAPAVLLEEILVDGTLFTRLKEKDVSIAAGTSTGNPKPRDGTRVSPIKIGPGKHRVEFHYTGLYFSAPERMRFRYRLEGLDPDWVEAGPHRSAPYSYVPHGEYRFEVMACSEDGAWNNSSASLALTVLPHFWQTWWFVGLAAIVLLSAVGGTVRLVEKRRVQRHLERIDRERAIDSERTRIAQDLHDDLGSSLARISLLSSLAQADKENPAQVETHVNKIAQSADETVRALEEIVWAVRPESDSLQSLIEYISHVATELYEGNGTRFRLDLPPELPARPLPPEMRHNIFLIVKEALTNSLKHAGAKEVHLQARTANDSLEISVRDDGHGFALQAVPLERNQNGLDNMRRRAEAMAGTISIESAPGKGTLVRLTVGFPN